MYLATSIWSRFWSVVRYRVTVFSAHMRDRDRRPCWCPNANLNTESAIRSKITSNFRIWGRVWVLLAEEAWLAFLCSTLWRISRTMVVLEANWASNIHYHLHFPGLGVSSSFDEGFLHLSPILKRCHYPLLSRSSINVAGTLWCLSVAATSLSVPVSCARSSSGRPLSSGATPMPERRKPVSTPVTRR